MWLYLDASLLLLYPQLVFLMGVPSTALGQVSCQPTLAKNISDFSRKHKGKAITRHLGSPLLHLDVIVDANRKQLSYYLNLFVPIMASFKVFMYFFSSPKSPPNSPNNELATGDEEMKGIFINRVCKYNIAELLCQCYGKKYLNICFLFWKDADQGKDWMMNYWTARCDSGHKYASDVPYSWYRILYTHIKYA